MGRCLYICRGNETVATSVKRLDDMLRPAAIAHSPAPGCDALFQRRVTDISVGPQVLKQLLPHNHPVAMLDEEHQRIQDTALELHQSTIATQFQELGIEDIFSKDIAHRTIPLVASITMTIALPATTAFASLRHDAVSYQDAREV